MVDTARTTTPSGQGDCLSTPLVLACEDAKMTLFAVDGIEVVECEHCGEKMNVLTSRLPMRYVERVDDGERSFLIIGEDDWLLRRCVLGEDG